MILGGTLTSGADGKSSTNALGNVHNEVRKDLRDGDIRQLNTTLSRDLVYAIAAINGLAPDGLRRAPQIRLNAQEREDLTAYATALPKLVAIGVRPTVQWVHERLGIPQAQDGEPVLGVQAAPVPPPPPAPPQDAPRGTAAASAQPPAAPPMPTPVAMQPQLSRDTAPAVADWIGQVRELVQRASSLQDIRDGLDLLLPNMSIDQYAQAMAEALSAAALAGRYDVLQDAGGMRA